MSAILNFEKLSHIRLDIITWMLVMHNQKRKKLISPNKVTYLQTAGLLCVDLIKFAIADVKRYQITITKTH